MWIGEDVRMKKDNEILDTKNFDVGGIKLTEKEKLFVFWYTYPDSHSFQCQTRAAEKAGYKQASTTGYKLRNKENVQKAIKYVLDKKLKKELEEEYHKIIEMKKARVHYDIGEYVEIKEKVISTRDGDSYTIRVEDFKDLKDLTPNQRIAIDSIDYKGAQGIKTYTFANRDKAMDDILKLYEKLSKQNGDEDGDELTAEIIKEGLRLRLSARKEKIKIDKSIAYIENSETQYEEL